jgi:hypothetical protein
MTPNGSPRRRSRSSAKSAPFASIDTAFEEAFGQPLAAALDLDQWRAGRDPAAEHLRLTREIADAVAFEGEVENEVRRQVLPRLRSIPGAPPCAGHYRLTADDVARTQRELLFAGGVECCDGFSAFHDSLAMTTYALGVSLVSYAGDGGRWMHRLYRHDLRQRHDEPADRLLKLLERRSQREGLHAEPQDPLSELARRALMSYAERAVLLERAKAPWRLGHGSPAPHELLAGGGSANLLIRSLRVICGLIDHGRFVYVASEADARDYLTLGQALRPLEYAVLVNLAFLLEPFLDRVHAPSNPTVDAAWGPGGPQLTPAQWLLRFRDEVAPKVVVGVYRAGLLAPPQLFYAHEDHVATAAAIAIADSTADDRRGFPMLIDLADRVCKGVFADGSLSEMVKDAYLRGGAPFRYLSERALRP